MAAQSRSIFDPKIIVPAIGDAFRKLSPVTMVRNPVMFVTEVGALVTTVEVFASHDSKAFTVQIAIWLWFTVLFANFRGGDGGRAAAKRRRMRCAPCRGRKTVASRMRAGRLATPNRWMRRAAAQGGRGRGRRPAKLIARRRRDHRRRGDHRRDRRSQAKVRAGYPRGGRRPQLSVTGGTRVLSPT